MLAIALGIGYYLYSTYFVPQHDQTGTADEKRAGTQAAATPGLSRTEHDRQRSGHYGDAVRNSSSLKAYEQRARDTEKAVQQISNSR